MLVPIVFFTAVNVALGIWGGPVRGGPGMRDGSFVLVTALAFVLALCLVPFGAEVHIGGFLVSGFSFRTDGFRSCYALVTAYMWLVYVALFPRIFPGREEESHALLNSLSS